MICTSSGPPSSSIAIANTLAFWTSRDNPRAACSRGLTRAYPMTAAVLLSSIFSLGLYCCNAILLYCCMT